MIQPGQLLAIERETKNVEIRRDPVAVRRFRYHDDAVIHVPAKHDLRGSHAVVGGDGDESGITEAAGVERAIALKDDATISTVG